MSSGATYHSAVDHEPKPSTLMVSTFTFYSPVFKPKTYEFFRAYELRFYFRFQNIFYNVSFIVLELADFLGLAMEPIFKVLPILGLLYVLVPYYNQFKEGPDFDDEDAEFGNGHCMHRRSVLWGIIFLHFQARVGMTSMLGHWKTGARGAFSCELFLQLIVLYFL